MIIHICKDPMTPDRWDAYNEKDRNVGIDDRLGRFRTYWGTLHRGFHPDPSKISGTANMYKYITGASVYWCDSTKGENKLG